MFVTLSANDSTLRAVLEITNSENKVDFNVEELVSMQNHMELGTMNQKIL